MAEVRTKVLEAVQVADNVVRLDLAVPEGTSWKTGEFARVALPGASESEWRCYSIATPAGSPTIGLFIARVKGGAISPKLCSLKKGDELMLDTEMMGMLLESRLEEGGKDLWLFATGTGVASFVAVASDPAITEKYENIVLVHGVRTWNETQYVGHYIVKSSKLQVMACVTREKGALINQRIPDALSCGLIERTADIKLDPSTSRVMICGNPAMVKSVRSALKERGFVTPRGGRPGQMLVENFWM